jgi:ADP-ribose pyrophosphatase YjhB (NUDIX family)
MPQKYKVYFANRPVFFSQEIPASAKEVRQCASLLSKGKMDTMAIEGAIAGGAREIFIQCADVEKSWKAFYDQFEFVQAAGGVVLNAEKQILFIFRNGKWDLPKGKVEKGESLDEGALREVTEECAIANIELVAPLCTTWHTYIQQGEPMLKATAWYIMNHLGNENPKPQAEEGITETRWFSLNNLHAVFANTYPSVVDVIQEYERIVDSE